MPGTLDDALALLSDEGQADTQAKPSYSMPAPAKPAGTIDDALTVLDTQEQTDQLRGQVEVGSKQDPARSTKVLQLFGKTGLPHDFIDRNLDYVNQEAAKQNFDPAQLQKDSPAFASWLAEHPDHVAAATPDVPALSFIEKQLRNIPAQYEQGKRTVEYGDVMLGIVNHLLSQKAPTRASQLADLIGGYIDEPRGAAPGLGNPTHPDDPRYNEFAGQMSKILGVPFSKDSQHDVRQFGETYNPEEYRGIRFLLPTSHGKPVEEVFGPLVEGQDVLLKEFVDEMKSRGYPLLGGVGQLQGFKPGFNPIGFGQRATIPDKNAGLTALRKRQAELEAQMSKPDETGLADAPGVSGVLQRAPGWMAQQLPVLGSTLQEQVKTGATGLAVGAAGGAAVAGPPGALAGGLAVGAASWRLGAAINSAKMEFGQAFGEYEKLKDENGQALDQQTAMGLAGMVGVINGSIDGFFGIEGLTSKLPGINQFTRQGVKELLKTPTTRAAVLSYAKTVGQVMATEGATEALQMYITKAGGVALQAVKDGGSPSDWLAKIFTPENLKQAATEAEAGAFGGGGIAGVMATPGLAVDISKVREANKAKQAFESIGKAVEGTKMSQELPDHLKAIISRATQDGPVENLYVPAEAFNTYFQKEGVDPREVYKEITGDVEAYDQAVQTGADLPIKTADYAQKLAGTKHNAFFADELRTSLDAMNAREAEEWVKQQDTMEQAAAEQPGINTTSATDPAAQVRQDIAGQLTGLGFDPTVVDQYAGLFESRYRARAERRGLGETAADLFKQQNLNITRGTEQQDQASLGQTFAQGGQQPLWSMSPDQLLAGLQAKDASVIANDKQILGDRYDEYKKLERQVNSDMLEQSNPAKYKQVTDRYNQIFESLTKAQQDQLFGVGEADAQVDEYRTYRSALQDIYGDTPEELGQSLSRAITEVGDGTDPSTMTREQQVAFAQIRWAMQEAKRMGWDLKTVSDAAIRASARRFSDPQDAEFMLQRFLKQPDKSIPNNLKTLFQGDDGKKASITFGEHSINIKLLEKADLSSFLHETGHLYLNELITDATTPGVTPQLTNDLDTILAWMGLDVRVADGADAIKGAIKTKHHEQFARGFEAYTMEGKSPSQAMREAFATFRQWLINAYRSLTTAPLNVKLTKPVREVLDRMIATDTEIDAAAHEAEVHPLFTNAIAAGMSPTEFSAYQSTVAKASLTARETLQKQLMAQYQRQQEQWWTNERDALRTAIMDRVNQYPEYVALSVLTTGTMPDGSALPAGVEPMKLDRKAIAAQFGQDFLATMPKGTMSKNGMHQDAAAQLFGFNSGQDLVMALVNARPKTQLIDAEADQQMQDRHSDMRFDGTIAEAAKAAVMNEHQEQVIAAEIRALNAKQREVAPFVKAAKAEISSAQQQGRALLKTMIPTLEDTRKLARAILARTTLKQLNPFAYSVAARQASKHATASLAKQDYLDAGLFKQRELLNLALFREATIIKQQIEKAHELATQFGKPDATLAKTRNVDLINVGRAILAQYGLAKPVEKTAADYLAPIKTYDKDLYDQWQPQVDALAPRPLDYNALTVEEFTKLFDDLHALWLLSRRTKQMQVNGQLVDRQQIVEELSAVMAGFTTQQKSQVVGKQTPWADTKVGLLSWQSALRRVESWVDAMDGGDIHGVFRRYIWTPISEASDKFRASKKTVLQKYLDLIKPIEGTITRDLIPASELGPGVSFRGRVALLHAVLHTGNESNQSKLLRGYQWEPANWDRFIERAIREKILTKADYDFAQGVWDLLESVKPQAQQAHHEMYGYYFSEITAKAITTPWGDYKGGYVPAIADRAQSVDQAIREEKDLFDQGGNSFMFPTTGKGFTKSRVEQYAAPLALDLTTIPVHLDKTMRFIHLEPRIKDAARLLTNKPLRVTLDAMNSTAAKDMLVPWLQRSAQQTVSTPGRNRHADQLFRYLRKSAGAQIMVGNVLNTLQQLTGFSQSLLKVKARYMRGALVNYLRHPVTYADDIASRSLFMKERTTTQVMEVQGAIDDILLNPTKYEKARSFAERHGYFMQQGTQSLVDLITWGAAYDQAHAQNLDEHMAVLAADSAVRQTQGSFAAEDISNFEAGTPFTRAFTMFYSYFNMQANLLGTEFGKVAHEMGLKKGAGRAFYIYLVGFAIPAVIAEGIVKGIGGFDPDDDDDYLNEALSLFFGSQLRSALAFFPGVGPATLAGINMFNNKWYDDRISTSPVVSLIESAVRAPHSLYQAMSEEGHSKRAIRDVLTLIGLVTGLPAGALMRPLGYLGDVADDKAQPQDAGDVARGLLSGRDVNRTR